jgi:hypothetical protein
MVSRIVIGWLGPKSVEQLPRRWKAGRGGNRMPDLDPMNQRVAAVAQVLLLFSGASWRKMASMQLWQRDTKPSSLPNGWW